MAYMRAKAAVGSPKTPVTLHLKIENKSKQIASVDVLDFESDLGNFAVHPELLSVAPEQVSEPDPMISQLGVTSDEIPVKVSLKMAGKTETQTVLVKNLLENPAPGLRFGAIKSALKHADPSVLSGKLKGHDRPHPRLAFDAHLAAMRAHDPLHDHQAQPVPAGLGRVVGLKELHQVLLADSAAAVPEKEVDRVVIGVGPDPELTARLHGLDRVLRQVEEHLLQLSAIGHDRRQVR